MTGTGRSGSRCGTGSTLAATLYLPDPAAGPQPCLLEALPYRKDDLTSSYAASYEEPARPVRVRGLPARPARHRVVAGRRDRRVPPRGAARPGRGDRLAGRRRTGATARVGMFGTSYSGFNSLQLACERPPALKAVCAIYASDDRWTDDVHWRGGALKLVDLVDYCHYMTPMSVLPPGAGGVGRRLGGGVARAGWRPTSPGC